MNEKMKRVGIVGLGLIGGSIAKAYKRTPGITVLGADCDASIVDFARLAEAVDAELTDADLKNCDVVFLAIYPQGVIDWVLSKKEFLAGTTVIDCAGTKGRICEKIFPVAKAHGFIFVGGHPMAGLHRSGFKFSREDLFDGEPMVIVPPGNDDIRLFDKIKTLLEPLGFGRISVTTSAEHDEIIAFASQMPHIISNAFVKSPTAPRHKGYSAGSYRDLSRVARLDPDMWTELFFENKSYLLGEFDTFIASMQAYRDALESGDTKKLRSLLDDGSRIKREVDGP
ncbi:MAG: prephenate dehydrogenase/arogenate dehydrogenase family protein [Defluviitaleaceae bacterium]|nr:prephenate dehydrogenase/arogenate dehydrogenase family protein [Defluviitaleaceae bacterium]